VFQDLEIWLNHFEYHAQHPRCVPAGLPDALKPQERKLIARSIATFQLGEQSDGDALLRAAYRFAKRHDAPHLSRITELFIREEHRHAALLRDFMEAHDIPLKSTDWTDFVFCCLRRLGGLEFRLNILITAELIGNVYYRALEVATACQRLKVLCRTLVADELAHVGFESQLLLALRARKSVPVNAVNRVLHRTFFAGAAAVVYITHRGVLRRAGYRLSSFLRACSIQYAFYLEPPRTHISCANNARIRAVKPAGSASGE
jgi:hypothetical protein